MDRWPNGVRGRQGRRRPRAPANCYFHYLLIQKSLPVTESLNSNKRDLKITAAVIDRVAKHFFSLIVSVDEKRCNWSPTAFFCPLSRCFHWSEKRMPNENSRGGCEEAGPPQLLLISVFAAWFPPGDRTTLLNNTEVQADFKSHQWFGATVRTHGDTILVRRFSRRWVLRRFAFLNSFC